MNQLTLSGVLESDGRIVRGELYYDQLTMLVQLGHMAPPAN